MSETPEIQKDPNEIPSHPATATCPSCHSELELDEKVARDLEFTCQVCGARVNLNDPSTVEFRLSVSQYYIDEFTRVADSDEMYNGRWNRSAFFFGSFWAISKGLWKPVFAAWLFIAIVGAIWNPVGTLLSAAYFTNLARRGNYMYYNRLVNRKRLFL